jgi:hypothetical protein
LEAIVDEEIGVEVGDHGRVRFERGEGAAHGGEATRVIGERGGREDVMADFVREDFDGEIGDVVFFRIGEIDDDDLILEADHREAAVESFLAGGGTGFEEQRWLELCVAAPGGEGFGPGGFPASFDRRRTHRGADETGPIQIA